MIGGGGAPAESRAGRDLRPSARGAGLADRWDRESSLERGRLVSAGVLRHTCGMGLPPWCTSDAESIEVEAAPYRTMTPSQRGSILARVCRAASRLLRS